MLRFGCVGEHLVANVAVVDDVVAQAKLLLDDCGKRLDAVCIDLAQLLDPAKNVVELGHEPTELLLAHRDARELGDVANLFMGD